MLIIRNVAEFFCASIVFIIIHSCYYLGQGNSALNTSKTAFHITHQLVLYMDYFVQGRLFFLKYERASTIVTFILVKNFKGQFVFLFLKRYGNMS